MEEIFGLEVSQLEQRLLEVVGSSSWPSVPDAIAFAKERHAGQQRKDGNEYVGHPLHVALLVAELAELKDANLVCAALLHDVVEDTDTEIGEVEQKFGPRVAELVNALTLPPLPDGQSSHEQVMAHFKVLAWAPRDAQILRSADRIANLKTIKGAVTEERRAEYLQETYDGLLELTLACNTALYHALKNELAAQGVDVSDQP